MSDAEKVEGASLEENETGDALAAIDNFEPEDLDDATKEDGFRAATAKLLMGDMTVPEWRWFAVEAINDAVDLPILKESQERKLLRGAFTVVGQLLDRALAGDAVSQDFRDTTLALLQGEATVPEWLDFAGDAIDAVVDIPYVPAFGEELIFDRGITVIAQTLHGLLVDGSAEEEA